METAGSIENEMQQAAGGKANLLVMMAPMTSMTPEKLSTFLANLTAAHREENLIIATPDILSSDAPPALKTISIPQTNASWTLTAADFAAAHQLAEANHADAILMLGPEGASLEGEALRAISSAVLNSSIDLALPWYDLPPRAGLVNSAILYPLTRALFASRARFPLAIDLGLSRRMAQRLGVSAQRSLALSQADALIWPVEEAAVAGYAIGEFNVGSRDMPQPADPNINAILPKVTASLFSEIDAKAAFWQRVRSTPPARDMRPRRDSSEFLAADIAPMLEAFRLAYTNLREIWSLVLPPNSLLGLKRLYSTEGSAFRMPDSLWARIVYDFLLAFRLRTIHRGHLMGALIPLYLAWAASHINITGSGVDAEEHIEAAAVAFESDKAYLVSRWRWPDRFNP